MNYIEMTRQLMNRMRVPYHLSVVNPDKLDYNLRHRLAREELAEYLEACRDGDNAEVLDALVDQMVILTGSILAHGMQDKFEEAFLRVQESNLSKVCNSVKVLEETIANYRHQGVQVVAVPTLEGDGFIVQRADDNKFLKSVNWKQADLTDLVP